ncbi:CRISPR-associated protein, TIGR02710 family [Rhodothermus marinus SG0.5JP17-172]|nr:CRISPR-associated protein, TIGR02710 family [Rhodothermus marinus SG0.5JP17-172]
MTHEMRRILVLNVGRPQDGNVETRPEAYALQETEPNYVVFICSEKGLDHAGTQEFVRQYANLVNLSADCYEELLLEDPDDLAQIYEQVAQKLAELRQRWPLARIFVDYTAGTKSMSAGLAMAAIDQEDETIEGQQIELRLVKGSRGKFSTVVPGTEAFRPVEGIHDLRARRRLKMVRAVLGQFDYAAATKWLHEMIRTGISERLANKLRHAYHLYHAFDAWDRWDLEEAGRILELDVYRRFPSGEQHVYERLKVLRALKSVRAAFEGKGRLDETGDPYVAVEDLLFNAERRVAQGRYDDAIARVYRAFELLAQIRLRAQYGVDTSRVDPKKVPEAVRSDLQPGRSDEIKVGLMQAWRILKAYPDEPLGQWFSIHQERLLKWLEQRNQSILAHGLYALGERDWRDRGAEGVDLCRDALRALEAFRKPRIAHVQLPRDELLEVFMSAEAS